MDSGQKEDYNLDDIVGFAPFFQPQQAAAAVAVQKDDVGTEDDDSNLSMVSTLTMTVTVFDSILKFATPDVDTKEEEYNSMKKGGIQGPSGPGFVKIPAAAMAEEDIGGSPDEPSTTVETTDDASDLTATNNSSSDSEVEEGQDENSNQELTGDKNKYTKTVTTTVTVTASNEPTSNSSDKSNSEEGGSQEDSNSNNDVGPIFDDKDSCINGQFRCAPGRVGNTIGLEQCANGVWYHINCALGTTCREQGKGIAYCTW
ncbi:hypothetical protein H4219_004480 [Mycoemilia scoparia]|uniref:Uncharacterized protein n=1 Tax=Mycoemilia scoparia TaxID=417184 RepID=A0A9W8A119_9FUNG|nr:hypothetical protein H4219_004480 [Mycoemilia scoparia]